MPKVFQIKKTSDEYIKKRSFLYQILGAGEDESDLSDSSWEDKNILAAMIYKIRSRFNKLNL